MISQRMIVTLGVISLVAQGALADVWNKKTVVSFSGPVQVPGVTLPAGKYVFKLVDSQSNRNIVQVTNVRENKVFATILAIPDYRLSATSKTVMYFTERAKDAPIAVKSWFYPGDNFGNRFVYSKVKAIEISAASSQPVPSMEPVAEPKAMIAAPVAIATPEKKEETYQPATFAKADATDTAGVDGEAVKAPAAPEAAPQTLPKTASPAYAIAAMGMLLLGGSVAVRALASRLR